MENIKPHDSWNRCLSILTPNNSAFHQRILVTFPLEKCLSCAPSVYSIRACHPNIPAQVLDQLNKCSKSAITTKTKDLLKKENKYKEQKYSHIIQSSSPLHNLNSPSHSLSSCDSYLNINYSMDDFIEEHVLNYLLKEIIPAKEIQSSILPLPTSSSFSSLNSTNY